MRFKKTFTLLAFLITYSCTFSQKHYFLYLQTENNQPFFVKANEKTYTAGAAGYVIIPKLIDSTYALKIGWAGKSESAISFSIPINKKDHGFVFKKLEGKGWSLFDLQTLEILSSSSPTPQNNNADITATNEVPAFTQGLSKASGDPSLQQRPQVISKPKETTTPATATNREVIAAPPVVNTPVIQNETRASIDAKPVLPTVATAPTTVTTEKAPDAETSTIKIEPIIAQPQKETTPNVDAAMQTSSAPIAAKKDVAPPSIDAGKEVNATPQPVASSINIAKGYQPSVVRKRSESSTTEGFGLTFIDTYANGVSDTIRLVIPTTGISTEKISKAEKKARLKASMECAMIATDNDFLQLRKLMAAANGDEAMIAEAKKSFNNVCYYTQQIKNLGALFLSDEGKFHFFEAAYPHTKDAANFASLSAELKDPLFINRFSTLLLN
ncbi:MAG: hypothetical protein RIR12_2524 [Bacteroidota bacterium]|jgi:hypothetical protein